MARPAGPEIIGQRFGRLVALRRDARRGYVVFRCDCGNEATLWRYSAMSGNTSSCGCLRVDSATARHTTHGWSKRPEYAVWLAMHRRCYLPSDQAYKDYGGRGIVVDESWHTFENFIADMGARRSNGMTLERIKNDAGYSKVNCIWASRTVQNRNKRSNVNVTLGGETRCLKEWAVIANIPYPRLYSRFVTRGWPIELALTEPPRR